MPHGLSQRVQAGVSPRFRRVARAGLAASLSLALIATAGSAALADQVRQTEWWLRTLHVTNAWEITRGSGVRIAVLDTGVAPAQAGLTGSVIPGPDYTNSGRTAGGPFWGIHGTEVASLIAGHGYGPARASGIIGIAPAAKILSVRVTLESNDPQLSDQRIAAGLPDAIARGIRWAVRQDASVIDLPLDPVTTAGAPGSGGSAAERAAVGYALAKHVVLVAPAGDGGAGTDPVNYPAAYRGVISVGAFDQHFVKAPFSSRQGYVTVTAAGVGVTAAGPFGTYPQLYSTSAASAIVAGIAALIRAQFPQLTPAQVTQAITSSTVYRRHGGRAVGSGYGTVDAAKALVAAAAITEAVPRSAASSTGSGQAAPSPPAVHSGPIHRNIRGTLIEDAIIAGLVFLLLLGLIFGAKAWRRRHARSARLAEVRAAAQIPVRKPGQAKKPSPAKAKAAKAKAAKAGKAKAGKAKAGKGAARKAVPAGALVTAGVAAAAGGAAETQEAAEPQLEPAGFIPAPLGTAAGGPGGSGFTGSAAPAFTGSSSGFTGSASGFTGSAAGFTGSAAPAFTGSAAPAFTGSSSGFTGSASGITGAAAARFTGSAATGFTGSASGFTGSAAPGFTESASPGVAAEDPSSPGVAAGGASSQGFTADSPSSPGFTAAGPSFPRLGPAGASSPVVPGLAPPPTAPTAPPADVVPPADLTPPAGPGTGTPPWARMQSDPRGLPREGAGEAIPGSASPGSAFVSGASPGGAFVSGASPGGASPGGASPGGASPGGASPGGAFVSGAFVSAASPAPGGGARGAPDSGAGTAGDGVSLGRIGTRLTQGPRQPRTPQVSGRPPWEPAPEPDGELPWAQAPMPPRSGAESLPRRAQARPDLPSWDELAQSVWPGGPKAAGPHPPVSSPADPKARPAGLAATGRTVPAGGLVPPTSSPGAAAVPPEGSAASATDAAAASQPDVFPARRPSLALPRRIGSSLARQAGGGRDAGPASEGPAGAGPTGASFPGAGPTGAGSGGAGWAGTGTSQPPFPPVPRPATDHGPPDAGQPERGPFPRAIKPPTDPGAPGAGTAGAGAPGAGREEPGAPWAGRPAAGSGPAHASQPEPGTTATSAAPAAAKPAAESPQASVPPWGITDSLPAVLPAEASGATESTGPADSIESFPAVDPRAERRSFPEGNLGDSTESFPAVRPHADMEDAFRLFPSAHGSDNPPPAADGED